MVGCGDNVIRLLRKTGLVDEGEDYMAAPSRPRSPPMTPTPHDTLDPPEGYSPQPPGPRGASEGRTDARAVRGRPSPGGAELVLSGRATPACIALHPKSEARVITEWPCRTRGVGMPDTAAAAAKPKLLLELEKLLAGPDHDSVATANKCMSKMEGAFRVYGHVLSRVQAVYNAVIEELQDQVRSLTVRDAAKGSCGAHEGGAGEFLSGFLRSTAEKDLGHEGAVLINQVRKLERKLGNYRAEVLKLSHDTRHLRETQVALERLEEQHAAAVDQRVQLQMQCAEQGMLIKREQQLKVEAQEELAETKHLLAAAVKANRAASPAWRKIGGDGSSGPTSRIGSRIGSRLGSFRSADPDGKHGTSGGQSASSLLPTAEPSSKLPAHPSRRGKLQAAATQRAPSDAASEDGEGPPLTPRPNFAEYPGIDEYGLPLDLLSTADVSRALYKELAEVSAKYALMLQLDKPAAQRIDEQLRILPKHPMWISDAERGIPERMFRPLGEPAWLPAYLHSVKPVYNMQFTLQDTIRLLHEYHYRYKGKRFETFFSDKAKKEFTGRSTAEVAYSLLHATQRYSDICTNCALYSLILSGYLGYWVIEAVIAEVQALEDAFRSIEGGIHFQRRAGWFVTSDPSGLLRARTCNLPDMVNAVHRVYAGKKSPQALLQLKNAAVATHLDHAAVTTWGHLLALHSDADDEVRDSEFLSTFKMQKVIEVVAWVRALASEVCARCAGADTSAPTITRDAARGAVSAADPDAPDAKVTDYTDRIFHTATAYHRGKGTPLTSAPASLWMPVPSLASPPTETRFDTMARLATLDMGQGPPPFSGVMRDPRDARDDVMTVAEFLHVSRYADYTPSTPAPATIPQAI
eukprot:TRINITY_DN16203_c0_g2_i1.p1 TRINITY_DN16203_c0_g2~~TRINITY_DN16203_c0_g2_i1.p1  ORF type:complete len:862 (+),score=280.85 TRINITY_DN16203_c0_g2_i1:57-2642(+)